MFDGGEMKYEQITQHIFDNHLDFVFFDKQVELADSIAHFHPYCQMIIPNEEGVEVRIGNTIHYQISKNDVLLLLPFVRHKVNCLQSGSYDTLLVNVNRLGADFLSMPYMYSINQMINQEASGLVFHGNTANKIRALFNSMENYIEIEYMAAVFNILSLSSKSEECILLPKDGLYPKELRDIQFCTTISNYILEHLDDNLDIPSMASMMHMSQSSFTRQFNRFFNQPFHSYVINKKIDTACYLLFTTKMSIQKLSEELGFSSLSHFIQTFKSLRHTTPAKYRKNQEYIVNQIK